MILKTLIDKAAKIVGSKNKLAKKLQVASSQVYDWYHGRSSCSPADRARIASIAEENAIRELVIGTLEKTKGTVRGEQLEVALRMDD